MCRQLVCLFSVVLVLVLAGNAPADYFYGDDFESYRSTGTEPYEPNDLRYTWDPNGATETWYELSMDHMHGGFKSLKIWYDNTYSPYYCGVSRTLDTPKDWTLLGTAKSLSLWFRGSPNIDQMYVRLKDSSDRVALVKYGDMHNPNNLQIELWQQWNIDLGYFTTNNADFDMTAVETLEMGVGEPIDPEPGVPLGGQVYFDDIKLYQQPCAFSGAELAANLNDDCVIDGNDVQVMADKWLSEYGIEADADKDGQVNFKDHAVVADNWRYIGSDASECFNWQTLHPEWIFCDDFETEQNLNVNYHDARHGGNTGMSVTTNDPFSGLYSLEQHYVPGQPAGWATRFIGDNPHLSSPGPKINEIYYRFYHKFEAGFTGMPQKMSRVKVFRTAGDWEGALGVYLWVNSYILCADKRTYIYDEQRYQWLPVTYSTLDFSDPANIGRWICIEARIKLDTPGQSDGVIQYWADGEQILLATGLPLGNESYAKGLNMVMWGCYWDGLSPKEQSRFYDNLVISTEPIGPVNW